MNMPQLIGRFMAMHTKSPAHDHNTHYCTTAPFISVDDPITYEHISKASKQIQKEIACSYALYSFKKGRIDQAFKVAKRFDIDLKKDMLNKWTSSILENGILISISDEKERFRPLNIDVVKELSLHKLKLDRDKIINQIVRTDSFKDFIKFDKIKVDKTFIKQQGDRFLKNKDLLAFKQLFNMIKSDELRELCTSDDLKSICDNKWWFANEWLSKIMDNKLYNNDKEPFAELFGNCNKESFTDLCGEYIENINSAALFDAFCSGLKNDKKLSRNKFVKKMFGFKREKNLFLESKAYVPMIKRMCKILLEDIKNPELALRGYIAIEDTEHINELSAFEKVDLYNMSLQELYERLELYLDRCKQYFEDKNYHFAKILLSKAKTAQSLVERELVKIKDANLQAGLLKEYKNTIAELDSKIAEKTSEANRVLSRIQGKSIKESANENQYKYDPKDVVIYFLQMAHLPNLDNIDDLLAITKNGTERDCLLFLKELHNLTTSS